MVRLNEPITLVKVGIFNGDLAETVKKFSEKLVYFPIGFGNTNKYSFFKECENPYWLTVCQQKDKDDNSFGYNSHLTVTSCSTNRNQEIADKFEKETSIRLDVQVPSGLEKHFQFLNIAFSIFEKNPKAAMGFLSNSFQ